MELLGLVLIIAGIAAIAVGVLQIRGPLATIRRLDETQANLERYATWRGKHTGIEADGPTGADVMRAQMRQRVMLWGAVIGGGIAAIVVGLFVALGRVVTSGRAPPRSRGCRPRRSHPGRLAGVAIFRPRRARVTLDRVAAGRVREVDRSATVARAGLDLAR